MTQVKEDKRLYTLKSEAPVRAVLKMGIPLVMGMFVMAIYNLVDTYFIGKTGSDAMIAAVNLAYPLMMILIALSNMVSTGCSSLIARSMGEEDEDTSRRTLTAGFTLTILMSAIVAAIGLIFIDKLVAMLGADEETFEYTKQYVSVLLACSLLTMGNYTFGQLLRAEGSVKQSLVGMLTGTVVNIVLDPVFIFALGMGVKGAAIATVIGNGCGMLCSVAFYVLRKTILLPGTQYLIPGVRVIKEIFWVGVPATLETLLTASAAIVLNNLAAAYGHLTVAAMGISSKIISFGSYIYQGFAAGLGPLMGYNYGAKNYPRMMALLRAGVLVCTGIELCVMAVLGIFAPQLIGIFTETPETVEIGAKVLRANMFILPFVSSISCSRSSFQAMGKPQYAFAITIVRQGLLYVPLQLLMNKVWGFEGMIWAQPVTECIMMAVSLILLTTFIKKLKEGTPK